MKKSIIYLSIFIAIYTLVLFWEPFFYATEHNNFLIGSYEAIRVTIVDYLQFPFWNPWSHGGVPLFANGEIGVFSLETIFCLIFGTFYGLKLVLLVYFQIAAIGMFKLLGLFTKNNFARMYGATIFVCGGCFYYPIMNGNYNVLAFTFLPWIVYFTYKICRKSYYAIMLGVLLGTIINHNLSYSTIFIIIVAFFYLAYMLYKYFWDYIIWRRILIVIFTMLTISTYRLIVTVDYLFNFLSYNAESYALSLYDVFKLMLENYYIMFSKDVIVNYSASVNAGLTLYDLSCYIGFVALFFWVISIFYKGIKHYHTAAIITFFLAFNTSSIYLPAYYMKMILPFNNIWSFSLWRFVMLFFISIGVTMSAKFVLTNTKRMKVYFMLIMAASVLVIFLSTWYRNLDYTIPKLKESDTLKLNEYKKELFFTTAADNIDLYSCVSSNMSNLLSKEFVLGRDNVSVFKTFPYQSKYYRGEVIGLHVKEISRTPNRRLFEASESDKLLLNINPSSYWLINDVRIFPNYRAFEEMKEFKVKLPKAGKYSLVAMPPKHYIALGVNILSFLILFLLMLFERTIELRNARKTSF